MAVIQEKARQPHMQFAVEFVVHVFNVQVILKASLGL